MSKCSFDRRPLRLHKPKISMNASHLPACAHHARCAHATHPRPCQYATHACATHHTGTPATDHRELGQRLHCGAQKPKDGSSCAGRRPADVDSASCRIQCDGGPALGVKGGKQAEQHTLHSLLRCTTPFAGPPTSRFRDLSARELTNRAPTNSSCVRGWGEAA